MVGENKSRLEKLKKLNNVRISKSQFKEHIFKTAGVLIDDDMFIDFDKSEELIKETYINLKDHELNRLEFKYAPQKMEDLIASIFGFLQGLCDYQIILFPSVHNYYLMKKYGELYMYPHGINSDLLMYRSIITSLVRFPFNDIVILTSNMNFGVIISENEYEFVSVDFWGVEEFRRGSH